jgi:GNAT superfamily N-acetyltransferase
MNAGHDPSLPHDHEFGVDAAVEAFIVGLARKVELESGVMPVVDADGGWFPGVGATGRSELITRPHVGAERITELASRRPHWLTVTGPAALDDLRVDVYALESRAPIMVRRTDAPATTAAPSEYEVVAFRGREHLAPLDAIATWPTDRFRTDTDRITTLAAECRGEPVGYGQLVDSVDGVGYLADLFVHPDHRGRGCAQALLTARIELAHSRGFTHVVLSASDEGRRSFVLSGFAVSTWYSIHAVIDRTV